MLKINEAEEILKKEYSSDNYVYLLDNVLLPDLKLDKHPVAFSILIVWDKLGAACKV